MITFKKERGTSGYIFVLLILLLSIVVVAYTKLGGTQITTLKVFETNFKSRFNAEAGVEAFISNFNLNIENDLSLYDNYYGTFADPYINMFFDEESREKPLKVIEGELNDGVYSVCFVEKYKQVEEIDYNNDGIIDDTIIVRRVFEVISVGSYIKMESAVYAEIEFFNNDGFVTTTINKWFTTK